MIDHATVRGIGAVVLAAGQGTRLGGVAKALLPGPEGRSFLAAIVASAGAAGVAPAQIVVVVGAPFGDQVAAAARALGASVAVNSAPARGMASSVATGFAGLDAQLPPGPALGLLWPVDHPHVAAATVAALLDAAGAADVTVPRWSGRGGHPAVVARPVWAALAGCADLPDGARAVLRDARWRRHDLVVTDPGVIRDIDDRDDLAARW